MALFMLLFPLFVTVLLMVVYRGFGATVLKWLWEQKVVLAVTVALVFTAAELVGMSMLLQFLPTAFMMVFQLIFAMIFMVVQFMAMMWIMSRPRVEWYYPGSLNLSFDDYVGNPVVRQLLEETVANIQSNNRFRLMKGEPSRGILMSGPPGTGKSYGGRVIASVCKVPFCLVDAASLQSAFMGMGSMTVMRLYSKARKLSRKYGACIIFLDEIDAVGQSRTSQGTGMGMMGGMMMGGGSSLLNTLLTNLDPPPSDGGWTVKLRRRLGFPTPFAATPYVLTMAATNRPEILDAALVRDGRMDINIIVDLPDVAGRQELFAHELKKVVVVPELDVKTLKTAPESQAAATVRQNLRKLALQTGGWSPASIKTIITNKAVAEAARQGREAVTMDDIIAARRTKSFGMKQPLLGMTDIENRRIAYHEAGHAFIAMGRRKHMKVEYATIIRRDDALGLVASAYDNERHTVTKSELLTDIDVALGSRAVEIEANAMEEMSGFSGDLAAATSIAANMIALYGMDDELVSMRALGATSIPKGKINRILQKRMAIVRALVRKHMDCVVAIAGLLLVKKEVDGDELYELFESFIPGGELVIDDEVLATAKTIEDQYVDTAKKDADFLVSDDVVLPADSGKGKPTPFSMPDGTVATASSLQSTTPLSCCRVSHSHSAVVYLNPDA